MTRPSPCTDASSTRRIAHDRTSRAGVLVVAASTALLCGAAAAHGGPCTADIARLDQQIAQLQAAPPPSGAGEPTAPQSVGAQLHHQPTPGEVQHAESQANADGDAALARARKADAAGNAEQCASALGEAKRLYGLD